jgi:hypothetical protein
MKTTLKTLAAACLVAVAFVTNAQAVPLTLNSPNVVGVYNGKLQNASVGVEIAAAQELLNMLAGTHSGAFDVGDNLYLYQTSNTEYAGTLAGGLQNANTNLSGYDWGFAKYDGQNAGYVLFYLGGALASTIIPNNPADLWTTNPNQFALSHVTLFGSANRVPDGGTTAILLGAALAGMALVARRKRTA